MRRIATPLLVWVAGCTSGAPATDPAPEIAAIEAQLHARFDRPDARLDSGPVAVSGDHAVADWTQGPKGGRALLERRNGKWVLVLCSGDALKQAEFLKQARVPAAEADAIVSMLRDAEQRVSSERKARMSGFAGTVEAEQMAS